MGDGRYTLDEVELLFSLNTREGLRFRAWPMDNYLFDNCIFTPVQNAANGRIGLGKIDQRGWCEDGGLIVL